MPTILCPACKFLMVPTAAFRRPFAFVVFDHDRAPQQAWMNCFTERPICTLRQECTDHSLVFGPRHLERCLREHVERY